MCNRVLGSLFKPRLSSAVITFEVDINMALMARIWIQDLEWSFYTKMLSRATVSIPSSQPDFIAKPPTSM